MEAGAQDIVLLHSDNIPVHRRMLPKGVARRSGRAVPWQNSQDPNLSTLLLYMLLYIHTAIACVFFSGFWLQQRFDDGSADEHAGEWRDRLFLDTLTLQEGHMHIGNEALFLVTEMVAMHAHVQAADQLLAAYFRAAGFAGEEDQAGTGAPGGFFLDPI